MLKFILFLSLIPPLFSQSYTVPPTGGSSSSNIPGYICLPSGASTTTYTCSPNPAATAYDDGMVISFMPDVTNTGSSTVNLNSLGAKTIQKLVGGTLTNVASGDLDSDVPYLLTYNGTVFVVSSGDVQWGDITGTLSNQTDLQSALDAKVDDSDKASQAEAEAGSDNTKWMSPLRTAQAISALVTNTKGFNVTRTSSTVLTISAGICSVGSQSYSHSSATAEITGGSGTARVYCDPSAGTLIVGYTGISGITCTGCTSTSGVTSFPYNAPVIYEWDGTGGAWDATGTNHRADVQRERVLVAGTGISLTESADSVTVTATGSTPTLSREDFFLTTGASWLQSSATAYTGGCTAGSDINPTGTNPVIRVFTNGSGNCSIYVYSVLPLVMNGATPLRTIVTIIGAGRNTSDGNTDLYWGVGGAIDNVNNGVFIRYNDASNIWQCVVRSGSADSGTPATITGTPDLNPHTFVIEKTTVTNEVKCSIDGGAEATVTGATVPTMANQYALAINPGGAANATNTTVGAFSIWVDR